MKQPSKQQPIKAPDTPKTAQMDHSAGPSTWTCRYKAERKLWIYQKVRKGPSMQ